MDSARATVSYKTIQDHLMAMPAMARHGDIYVRVRSVYNLYCTHWSFIFKRLFSSPGNEILKGPHQTV